MGTSQASEVVLHLRRILQDSAGLTDKQLLENYLSRRDETALAVLVERHGSMVWGVCRRVLPNYHDAEDAFQATFLVFVRKAAAISSRELLANWLYAVAHQTALKARATATKRCARERQVLHMPEPAIAEQDIWRDLQPLLDEELSRLPDKYRAVVVLCDLEGKTRKEAARQVGVPEGTIASRQATARKMLTRRLSKRGVVLSGGALATVLTQQMATAGVPKSVLVSTIKVASLLGAGQAAGIISANVTALSEGVIKAMLISKLKTVVAVVFLAVCVLGVGAGVVWQTQVQAQELPESTKGQPLPDLSGTWFGDEWGTVVLRSTKKGEFEGTYSDTFGKDVGRIAVQWSTASRRYEGTWSEGKFRFGRIALEAGKNGEEITGAWTTDPKCEHEPGVPSLASLKWSKKPPVQEDRGKLPQRREKEAFTAWGKEVGGLQAGLGFRPGEKRPYTHGETVNLVVRVRNVSKEDVKFRYLEEFFMEKPPTVTGGEGKTIRLGGVILFGRLVHIPVDVNLAPGKEMELHDLKLKLGPASEGSDVTEVSTDALHGKGKFQIQYEQLAAASIDPNLTKLATGKLELEVKADSPPPSEKKTPPEEDKDNKAFTAWGKEINGVQAGLGFRSGEHRAYHHDETVTMVVRVRNVGKEKVKFEYLRQFFIENPPTVTRGYGKPVPLEPFPTAYGRHIPVKVDLEPSKEIELYELKFRPRPVNEDHVGPSQKAGSEALVQRLWATGKVTIQYERVFGNSSSGTITLDPALSKLFTGRLELEIKAEPPPPSEKKTPQNQDKEPSIEWGKEADGLQAGIRLKAVDVFHVAENRWEAQTPTGKIHQGSVIRFELIVRNLSKQEISLKYYRPSSWPCFEDGQELKFSPLSIGGNRIWDEKTLQPGENWEVTQLNIHTRRPKPNESFSGLVLPKLGKYKVSCPSVLMLEKKAMPATGEIEIEILAPKGEKSDEKNQGQEDKKADKDDKR